MPTHAAFITRKIVPPLRQNDGSAKYTDIAFGGMEMDLKFTVFFTWVIDEKMDPPYIAITESKTLSM